MKRYIPLLATFILTSGAFAQSNVNRTFVNQSLNQPGQKYLISAFGVATSSDTPVDDNDLNYGLGVFVEGNFRNKFAIETGAYVVDRQYRRNTNNGQVTRTVDRLTIPVLAKFWITDFFSLGVGPYASFSFGDGDVDVNTTAIDTPGFDVDAPDDLELGIEASAGLTFALDQRSGIFAEGRFTRPFDSDANNDLVDQFSLLAGVKFSI